MKRVSLFGATGSIGENTVDLLMRAESDAYDVVAVTGGRNVTRLAEQARDLDAQIAVTAFDDCYGSLKDALADSAIEVASGAQALCDAADRPCDWTMSAIVGAAGLYPGFAALRQGGTLALANKESLVCAGPLLLAEAKANDATIMPVDSEHSAVFQALVGEDISTVERIIITASGGPFRDWPLEAIAKATLKEAVAHPNWAMGQRISIDSASMFNKALELIETHEFFGISPDRIEAVVHPESLVHALVGFQDGALMAHIGPPDMRHAIGYALHWPERAHVPVNRLDLAAIGQLNFSAPDTQKFPALRLAREVMETGGRAGAAFNGAKEAALDLFIAGKVGFLDMARLVEVALEMCDAADSLSKPLIGLDCVTQVDHMARKAVKDAAQDRV